MGNSCRTSCLRSAGGATVMDDVFNDDEDDPDEGSGEAKST
jgi:hypothetical protein